MRDSPWHILQPEFPESEGEACSLPVAQKNRLSVLRLLLKDTRLSQRRLAQWLQLRASTLSNITSELREAGIAEDGELLSVNRLGPPERALRIPRQAAWGCGVEIDRRGTVFTLVNGRGEVVGSSSLSERICVETSLASISDQVHDLRRRAGLLENPHGCLSISIPGIVNYRSGEVVLSRALDLRGFPLRDRMAPLCPVPVWVDRNVIYGAYHESIRADGSQWGNFAYFLARSPQDKRQRPADFSLGMAFVIGNRFYRGFNHAAGELDHEMFPEFASETGDLGGDSSASACFRECSTRHLASVINLMDVGKLIVAADANLLGPEGFSAFEERLRERLLPLPQRNFTVRLASAGPAGVSIGAALFALHRSLEERLLTHMVATN